MAESSSTPEEQQDDIEQPTDAEEFASDQTEDDEDDLDDGAESEDSEDEEDMEEEPKLRYRRVGAGVRDLLEKDTASALRVSDKFVAMGTHWGAVHVLDFEGNIIKTFQKHAATVNDISIDHAGEYVASASDDGKVFIYALYTNEVQHYNYRRPVKAVALDPEYARRSTKQFVSGGMAEQLIMNEKGWLGHKDQVLHANEGPIYSIVWNGTLIAWANDTGVKIYDTSTHSRITYIERTAGSPRADLYKCRMCWKNDSTLLIAWADTVTVAIVKERQQTRDTASTTSSSSSMPPRYVEIATMFQTDYIVCGIAPFQDTLLLLAFMIDEEEADVDTQDPAMQRKRLAMRPELHIINELNEEISADVLSMHGYEHYQANDYMLEFLDEEDMFYVLGPKDMIAARPRDMDDHIEWLMDHERYGEAFEAAREAEAHYGGSHRFDVGEIGQTYLNWLIEHEDYEEAAKQCRHVLGNDKTAWEDWVFKFTEMGELKAIAPHLPMKDPQLSSTIYEVVLAWFLKSDHAALRDTIHKWPRSLYSLSNVIVAVEDYLPKDKDNEILIECLADLYTYNNQPDKAIEYNLRLRRPNAFELIQEYNMFDAVKDKAVLLMEFDQHLLEKQNADNDSPSPKKPTSMPAVQMLAKNTDAIPPPKVVQQLRSHRQFLHTYLDALFDRDRHIGYEFHNMQIELYADYDYPKLIEFLRASHYVSLEKAYKICEEKDLVPEMVFILGRMGDNKQALMLIIERLDDVQRAIDFAKEQKDDDLWEDLLTYSMDKPNFIRGLLENVGTDIEPLRLIKRIPDQLEIPGLKDALLKILQDYNLQMSLHEGCEKILVSDSVHLADRMYKTQKRGINCHQDMLCSECDEPVFDNTSLDDFPNTIIFFCRHAFHERCLLDRDTSDNASSATAIPTNTIHPGSLHSKVNHAALLKSTRDVGCPLCREQAAGGNAFVNRMKTQRRKPMPPGSVRSLGVVH